MITKDYLIKAMDVNKELRITMACTTQLVEEAHQRHNTSATASAALGRVFTAALLMGSDLKGEEDSLTVRVNGDGIAGTIVATVDSHGTGRALISSPQADLPSRAPGKLDVGALVGKNGFLEVIKDLGLKQPFIGRVDLVSGEIAEDLAQYFAQSEQIPSLVSLGVLVDTDLSIKSAGGLIIQAMPGAADSTLEQIERNVSALGPISEAIKNSESLEQILEVLMAGIPYYKVEEKLLKFSCKCNRSRLAVILAGLNDDELADIYKEDGKLEVTCNFCNESYSYSREEIEEQKKRKTQDI
jgi:molecular chaperone Hsp33